MNDLPAPPVPAEVDLTDFKYMPLEIRRLLHSETWIDAADEPYIGHALVCLWAQSWHQIPASSLPDNDRVLARFAMCDRERWERIKTPVMRGWIKCSDGLLYHPIVAEKALEAWDAKRKQRDRTKAATEARARQRREQQEERNVERDDQRYVERNVHQGKGSEGNRREGAPPPGKYAFEGSLIRLTERDLEKWRGMFRETIPDLEAELIVIDGKFAQDGTPAKQAFNKALAWLNAKHQRTLTDHPQQTNGHNGNGEADQWRARIKGFVGGKRWLSDWGPAPLSAGCMCPPPILAEFKAQLDARGNA